MFNRKAAHPKSRANWILSVLSPEKDWIIADIGAGGGYFSFRFAELVPNGKVYAMDINEDFLAYIGEEAVRRNLENIVTVRIPEDGPETDIRFDLIFMRNVTHHIKDRPAYFKRLKAILKPTGKLAVIEYRKGGGGFHHIFGHHVDPALLKEEAKGSGLVLVAEYDSLPEQSFLVFSRG